ncbi:MFS transporter [Nonomuraea antimicrobica]|uniref:MFS transporter n=1 Tax=Nonomuraea antimicrobica TaxID=561173 RepID=A0ABP7CN79_9ACTN
MNSEKNPLALAALALGAFAVGTTEVVIAGLLPQVASGFGVSVPAAGLLVSGYALGMVVGAPALTVLGNRLPRKTMLLALAALLVVGSLLCAVSGSYGVLMTARVLSALAGGAFVGVASVVAAGLVPAEKKAAAIAKVFMGLSLANVLGVPAGTAIGQEFGWRTAFWMVSAVGVIVMAGLAAFVPHRTRRENQHGGLGLAAFRNGRLWLALLVTALGWAPFLAVVTYIVPLLTEVTGLDASAVPFVLVLVGVGMLAGSPLGGRLADQALMPTVYAVLAAVTLVSVLLVPAVQSPVTAVVALALFGMAGAATIPPFQARVLSMADGARDLASAANVSAFNVGNAAGPFLGGLAIEAGLGYTSVLWVAAALGAAGLLVAPLTRAPAMQRV